MARRRRGRVLVAMSGGVDSSVAAALMVRRGFEVVGVTLQIWQESQTDPSHNGCCSLGAVEDARRVAQTLGISHYVLNYRDLFRETVIADFVREYAAGRTPNPCVQCNRHVKFDQLIAQMRELGCDTLVTGHYARVRRTAGGCRLLKARGVEKDQSYVLATLTQEQLSAAYFPLGELGSKDRIRSLASDLGLHVAAKPDSQEICFVSEPNGYAGFLRRERPGLLQEGEIVNEEGQVLGTHGGFAGFTVGQRRGIGGANRTGKPLYVLRIDPGANRVVVGAEEGLLAREAILEDVVWSTTLDAPARVEAKVRSNMAAQRATLSPEPTPRLVFDRPVRAIAPGQTAVAYIGQTVVAGGTIRSAR